MDPQKEADSFLERDLFLQALEKSTPQEQAAFLDEACGNRVELRTAVVDLLRYPGVDSFLEEPVLITSQGRWMNPAVLPDVAEKPGDRIGHYKLLNQLGEGGFGVVFMAEQEEPVRRKVALKIIKLGMDTKQ